VTIAEPAIFDHLARIEVDGYTIVEGAIEPELVTTLRDTIRRLERELHVEPRGTSAEGHATRRMYNLLAKDPVFQEMPVHDSVLPIVERVLDRGCLLSGMTAIDIGPGEHEQPMHGDDIVMSRHLQRPHAPMMVTSMWALDDFTEENGGTLFVPGSHLFALTPDEPGARYALRASSVLDTLKPLVLSQGRGTVVTPQELIRNAMATPPLVPMPPDSETAAVPLSAGSGGTVEMNDLQNLLPK